MIGGNLAKLEAEVLPFLTPDARLDVKCMALQYFMGLTGTDEGKEFITKNDKYLEALVSLTEDVQPAIVKDAYLSLINLSAKEDVTLRILNLAKYPTFCYKMLTYVLAVDSEHADPVSMLLSNLSRFEPSALKMSKEILTHPDDHFIEQILEVLCNLTHNKNARLHYLSTLLSNLTQVSKLRHILMDHTKCIFQKLLPFVKFEDSLVRRGGVIGTIRNCCFDTEQHDWLLSDSVDLLPRLLLPLAGPEEFDDDDMERLPDDLQYLPPDKMRLQDPDLRKMLVESLIQLCATRNGRRYLKEKNTYVIIREYHKWEPEKRLGTTIHNLVDLLISDEPSEEIENLKDVDVPEHLKKQFEKEKEEDETENS